VASCAYCESWVEQTSSALCASCGKPTNDEPFRAGSAESDSTKAIIVIVSLLASFVSLGILAAFAMLSSSATQRTSQRRTLASIRAVGELVDAYARDHSGVYPRAESMAELQTLLYPNGGAIPLLDAWGNDLRYGCLDDQCKGYAITSSGADRMFEHFYASKYPQSTTTNLDCDIVWMNGVFRQYPEDSQ
jgi:type II secretory pathway pseudopilin PulG